MTDPLAEAERLLALPYDSVTTVNAREVIRALLTRLRAAEADVDELKTLRKIAKCDSVEDVLAYPHDSEMAIRLRLFVAIASLRVELAANKGHGALVQKMCDTAAGNLIRAEQAEAERDALKAEVARLTDEIAEAREACPLVRRQDYFDADLKTLIDHEICQLFSMQSRAEAAEAQVAQLRTFAQHEPTCEHQPTRAHTCGCGLAALLAGPPEGQG